MQIPFYVLSFDYFVKIKERVFDELCSIFDDDWHRDCNQEDLNRLKFLECCIKESLRLYPSVPAFTRLLKEDLQLGIIICILLLSRWQ